MSDHQTPQMEWRFTGRHMLAVMVAFFGVIIAVNLTLAMFASGTWTGLVVKNSYVASQQFNEKLADARRQGATGWTSTFGYRGGTARFVLSTREGEALRGFGVTARFGRPTHERDDREMMLTEVQGAYETAIELAPGAWNVEVTATAPEDRGYRRIFRLFVKQDG